MIDIFYYIGVGTGMLFTLSAFSLLCSFGWEKFAYYKECKEWSRFKEVYGFGIKNLGDYLSEFPDEYWLCLEISKEIKDGRNIDATRIRDELVKRKIKRLN